MYNIIGQKIREQDWQFFADNYISVVMENDLVQVCYNQTAAFTGYNDYNKVCRGHVYTNDGKLVAIPFDKFFNYGERGLFPSGNIVRIAEKLDGSLIIVFWHNDRWYYGTKKTAIVEISGWQNSEIFKQNFGQEVDLSLLDKSYTYMFEWIGTSNQHIVTYDFQSKFVYLGRRNVQTYEMEFPTALDPFALPKEYQFETANDIKTFLDASSKDFEGFVVEYDDGRLWKFKGEEYVRYHALYNGFSYNSLFNYVLEKQPKTMTEVRQIEWGFRQTLEEEFEKEFDKMLYNIWEIWIDEFWTFYHEANEQLYSITGGSVPNNEQKKDFIQYMNSVPRKYRNHIINLLFKGMEYFNPYRLIDKVYGRDFISEQNYTIFQK